MHVGIVGGTGPAGQALAARLGANGVTVIVGSRSAERGEEIVAALRDQWPGRLDTLSGATNEQACEAEIVVLATPWEGAVATAAELALALEGKVLVSMVNALARVGKEFQALVPACGSIAASVQAVVPKTFVTAAFQHVPAGHLGAIDEDFACDVLVCADVRAAYDKTAELVESMAGFRAVRSGSLASANAVEALTAVLLNINIAYKTHVAVSLTGLPEKKP